MINFLKHTLYIWTVEHSYIVEKLYIFYEKKKKLIICIGTCQQTKLVTD